MISAEELVQPTGEQCDKHEEIRPGLFACWYPQMGGYSGTALVEICLTGPTENFCFDAYVWHDGEFPFESGQPRQIHHCDSQQFIWFGEYINDYWEKNHSKIYDYHGGKD